MANLIRSWKLDMNKIMRASYGSEVEYQELALDSVAQFTRWNEEIQSGKTLPPGFNTSDIIYCRNGNLTVNDQESLTSFDIQSIDGMKRAGLGDTQFVTNDPNDIKRAEAAGFGFAINPFNRSLEKNYGVLDTWGGMVYADRACRFALYKAELLGVKLVLGDPAGKFVQLLREPSSGRIVGIETADKAQHHAALTIMACGGWTPSLIPQLDGICETTGGSVSIFQLPSENKELWEKFAPTNFPTWKYVPPPLLMLLRLISYSNIRRYKIRDGAAGGLYGFARDPRGKIKIGYRGTKYTNPQIQADGKARSVPITRWTQESTKKLPQQSAGVIRRFVDDYLPELRSCPVKTRLCWYTDTFDNHFVIDFGLMVATGGSGHGFKFLPNLGRFVVDRIEGKKDEESLLKSWQWRTLPEGEKPFNSIMEGPHSERALQNQLLTRDDSLGTQKSSL
ncbi:hypothetical protein N7470_005294 [Penicillium chermesinum]|nr:hypothetical protein N7470_005294 [Penicillium chermesinum]